MGEQGPAGLFTWHDALGTMPAAHRHNDLEASVLVSGESVLMFNGVPRVMRPGQLVVFWAAIPHQVVAVRRPGAFFVIHVPLPWLVHWKVPGPLTGRLLDGRLVVQPTRGGRTAADVQLFRQWHRDVSSGMPARAEVVRLELEARLRRLAGWMESRRVTAPAAEASGPARGSAAPAAVMARFIAERHADPISVADVARHAGLNANYASWLFRRSWGVTLVEFVQRYRVAEAQRLLIGSSASVLDVALRAGFGSASQFHAVFRQVCEQSPSAYRRSFRPGG